MGAGEGDTGFGEGKEKRENQREGMTMFPNSMMSPGVGQVLCNLISLHSREESWGSHLPLGVNERLTYLHLKSNQ